MNVTIPTTWNDLTARQLSRVARTLFYPPEQDLAPALFFDLIEFRWYRPADWLRMWRLHFVPDYELIPHITYLLQEKPALTKWIVDCIPLRSRRLYGPDRDMRTVTWQEFTIADSLYLRYRQHQSPYYLKMLCAVLFRPHGQKSYNQPHDPDFCGDLRREFNPNISDEHLRKLSEMDSAWQLAVLLNYEGIRRHIEEDHPHVFNSDHQEEVIQGPKGWEAVTISLSGEKFGDYHSTKAMPFKLVLKHMEMNAVQIERLKDTHNA